LKSARWRTISDATTDHLDGLRLDWQDQDEGESWLLVRASNTEPIVRIIAEAQTAAHAKRLCDEATTVISAILPA
jgi:phosphomannomutase